MDGPPTVISKLRNGSNVLVPLLLGIVLFGTDVGKRVGPGPDELWNRRVLSNLGQEGWPQDHPVRQLSPPRYGTKAWLFVAGMIAYYGLRDLKQYDLGTVGTARRVDVGPIEDGDVTGEDLEDVDHEPHCTVCGERIEEGEHRQYADQLVVLGVPVRNREWGHNDYCRECAGTRIEEGPVGDDEVGPNRRIEPAGDADGEGRPGAGESAGGSDPGRPGASRPGGEGTEPDRLDAGGEPERSDANLERDVE